MSGPPGRGDVPGVQLRSELRMPDLSLAEAWSWLVEDDRLERWLATRVERGSDAAAAQLSLGEIGEEWRTVEVDPPRRWVGELRQSGWRVATRVEIELVAHGTDCALSVVQQGFERLPLSECLTVWEEYRRRWRQALARLAAASART
jgi:hypothetical protein